MTVIDTPAGDWAVAGQSLADAARCAQVEAVTAGGTNSDEDKASFARAAYAMVVATLGEPAAPVYVMVYEMPAKQWGHDGRSQAQRQASRIVGTPS